MYVECGVYCHANLIRNKSNITIDQIIDNNNNNCETRTREKENSKNHHQAKIET